MADLFREQPRVLTLASLASIAPPAVGYTVIVYMLTYGTTVVGFSRTTLLSLILLSTIVWIATIAAAAMAADRFGSKKVFTLGALTAVLWPLPMFALVNTGSVGLALFAFIVAAVVQGIMAGAQGELPAGVSLTLTTDTRFQTSPSPLKAALGGLCLAALLGVLVLLGRADRAVGRRVRLLPRGWWRPRPVDAVVGALLAGWWLVGVGHRRRRLHRRASCAAGTPTASIGNVYRWLNAPEAPFSWFYELYVPVVAGLHRRRAGCGCPRCCSGCCAGCC